VLDLEPDAAVTLAETFDQFAVVILESGQVARLHLTSLVTHPDFQLRL
jgi:hypothetical protein